MSSLRLSLEKLGVVTIVHLVGRLDAHGSQEAEPSFRNLGGKSSVIIDLGEVSYLSSGGIRLFVSLQKQLQAQGGKLVLAAPQPYCREVLRVSGLDQFFAIFATLDEAAAELGALMETIEKPAGKFIFHQGSSEQGTIEVLGSIQNVLAATITAESIKAKKFSAKEYSIGLGGLGPSVEEVLPLMGEMITIGGTMVWLPTDGYDTPDFLVPRHDSDDVMIQTGFNVSISGKFNEYVEFESSRANGTPLGDIYSALFELARERRPDYRGALGITMRAEVGEAFGCGVVKAPIAANAPENGKLITDPTNYESWFEVDTTPRHRDVTGLICGIGVDLEADLSVFDQQYLKDAFYINPGNHPGTRAKTHNHGVFFKPFPLGEKPWTLEREINRVVEEGTFVDMRHLFDTTTIIWALIGIVYVQDFRPDQSA